MDKPFIYFWYIENGHKTEIEYNITKYIKRGFMKPIPNMTEGKVSEKLTMKVENNYNTGRKYL